MNLQQLRKQRRQMMDRLQRFAEMVLADGMRRGREMVVGKVSREVQTDLRVKGVTLLTTDVIIDDAIIVKYIAHVKGHKGAVIDPDKYWMVAKAIMKPAHIYEDTEQKYLVYVSTLGYSKVKVLKVIVHPNFRRKGRAINYLKSIGVVDATKMGTPQFRQIK